MQGMYKQPTYKQPYIPPTVTVDGVVFQLVDGRLSVLLVKRAQEPFAGEWALPGGYCAAGETTQDSLVRRLKEKAGVSGQELRVLMQIHVFDSVARDPRGHAVSITYMGLGRGIVPDDNDTQEPCFFDVAALPKLAYDHQDIVRYAHEQLKANILYTNISFALLGRHFTLTQLQSVYEAILGTSLDKRNFRKRILQLAMIRETAETDRGNAYRPARLYEYVKQQLEHFPQSFH